MYYFSGKFSNFGSKFNTFIYMKRKSNQMVFFVVAALAFGAVSCSKDIYDENRHYEIIKYVSPVDSVDQKHTWQLSNYYTYSILANASVGAEKLELYSNNPVESSNAELLARTFVKDGQQVTLSASVPSILTTLYAALVDGNGNYTVTSFSPSVRYVDFSTTIATKAAPLVAVPKLMAYTYCFEENFPEPGDYDFNDVVMRISLERTGKKEITIDVTLTAVGSTRPMAGALRLVGYRYEDIDSVVAVNGKTFNANVPSTCYELIETDDILLKGRNKEAVINLFLDAHWAIGDEIQTVNDDFIRKKYNVARTMGESYDVTYAKTAAYTVYFKSETALNGFTQEMLDPFLITYYAGARLEIHLDEFRDAQIFHRYNTITFKDIPWALKIPTRYFQYPLEGNQIGFRKRAEDGTAALFGAYMTMGHSFGEWVENHDSCLDWYEYPTSNRVY
jgi:LruC domain-containing protein